MLKKLIAIIFLIVLSVKPNVVGAQLLDNAQFKIYRTSFYLGTVTQLKLSNDFNYEMGITEIHCSLCDHEELSKIINRTGKWSQIKDTIILDNHYKFLIMSNQAIRPLFVIALDGIDTLNETQEKYKQEMLESDTNDFNLIYDTYPNGMAKKIIAKYRNRKEEYEIEFNRNGSIEEIKYFRNNKRKKDR